MGENKGDASGPSAGSGHDWLEGRQGLSRESLDRAEAEIDGTESDAWMVSRLRAVAGGSNVVARVRAVASTPVVLAARIREALASGPDDVTGEVEGETFTTEADGGPELADHTGRDEQEAGTARATDGAGSRKGEDRAGAGRAGDESAFNWGGADGDAEPAE